MREKERVRDGQIDGQAGRQTDKQTDRQTDRRHDQCQAIVSEAEVMGVCAGGCGVCVQTEIRTLLYRQSP